ncbi:MAG: acetylglutamate kinase [Thermaerobacter sp.]|nr:acetylglutamate kinase [Thermaerobacter sp.]
MRVVLKIGGSVLGALGTSATWLQELHRLLDEGHQCLLVHGGGAVISQTLAAVGEPVQFVDGQRVTTAAGLVAVVRVLCGEVNKDLVAWLTAERIAAVGISGADGSLLTAVPFSAELDRVGRIVAVDATLLKTLWQAGFVPVVAPVAADGAGGLLNCNGDYAAAEVAGGVEAHALVFYTDSGGLRQVAADAGTIAPRVARAEIGQWIDSGRASAGMIPKLRAAARALESGVGRVRIGTFFDQAGQSTEFYG